jgi:hypothetical protein
MNDDFNRGDTNYWIDFAGLDAIPRGGGAIVRFDIVRTARGDDERQATLSFQVGAEDDGVAGMLARSHDLLVDALRQMLHVADKKRRRYRKESGQIEPSGWNGGSSDSPD